MTPTTTPHLADRSDSLRPDIRRFIPNTAELPEDLTPVTNHCHSPRTIASGWNALADEVLRRSQNMRHSPTGGEEKSTTEVRLREAVGRDYPISMLMAAFEEAKERHEISQSDEPITTPSQANISAPDLSGAEIISRQAEQTEAADKSVQSSPGMQLFQPIVKCPRKRINLQSPSRQPVPTSAVGEIAPLTETHITAEPTAYITSNEKVSMDWVSQDPAVNRGQVNSTVPAVKSTLAPGGKGPRTRQGRKRRRVDEYPTENPSNQATVAPASSFKRKCNNCETTAANAWRRGPNSEQLCAACGQYYYRRKRHRPSRLYKKR